MRKLAVRRALHALVWAKRHITGQIIVNELSAINRYIQPHHIVLDIGAHAGAWTIPIARSLSRRGHVYAFEALPYYAQTLRMCLMLLGVRNVTVINKAVSQDNGIVQLAWRDTSGNRLTGLTHIASSTESVVDALSVESITIDAFTFSSDLSSPISFIKIDAEGAELQILRGAKRTLERYRPVMFMEVVTDYCQRYGYSPAEIFAFLADYDYRPHTVNKDNLIPITVHDYKGYGDVLFLP